MKPSITRTLAATLSLAIAACSSMSSISSSQSGTRLLIKEKPVALPARESIRGTSVGNSDPVPRFHFGGVSS